jgi:hypothetical protein
MLQYICSRCKSGGTTYKPESSFWVCSIIFYAIDHVGILSVFELYKLFEINSAVVDFVLMMYLFNQLSQCYTAR